MTLIEQSEFSVPDVALGVSDVAGTIKAKFEEISRYMAASVSLRSPKLKMREMLIDACQASSEPNWDGYGALPVDCATYSQADHFLRALPRNIPLPEISADPDGQIAVDWRISPKKALAVSIGANQITFAAILGSGKVHGSDDLGNEIPTLVLQLLGQVAK